MGPNLGLELVHRWTARSSGLLSSLTRRQGVEPVEHLGEHRTRSLDRLLARRPHSVPQGKDCSGARRMCMRTCVNAVSCSSLGAVGST